MLAYLVIREGSKWTDVFRLVPGQAVTIGRAPTNQIVIKDERCSRCHAEVFFSQGQWVVRDLESRNGTMVGGENVRGDYVLEARRHHSHRPVADGVRPRSVQGVSRFERRLQRSQGRAAAERRNDARRIAGRRRTCLRLPSRRRSRIAAGRPSFSSRSTRSDVAIPKVGRAAASFAAWRSSWPKRPTSTRWPSWPWPACSRHAGRRRGACCSCRATVIGEPTGADLEVIASRTDSRLALSSRLEFSGLDRAPRRRGGAGPQRDGRQHARQPRQQGGDPRHERASAPDPPRHAGLRPDPSVFDRSRARARSRRSGVHAGRGRHRGRGARESQPAAGTGREPEPDPRRKPATSRAAGRAKRDRRQQPGHGPRQRRKSPAPPPAGPRC